MLKQNVITVIKTNSQTLLPYLPHADRTQFRVSAVTQQECVG